jgi:hypothetical protein
MALNELLTGFVLFFLIPLWLAAGFGDWLCHRRSGISRTAGVKESALHLLMIGEIGLPILAGLFLEINALVLALMAGAFLLHEATVYWDLRYAAPRRVISPVEQLIHSFQELIPLMALSAVALLHWDQFAALLGHDGGAGRGRYLLEWKRNPLPAAYLAVVLAATAVCVAIPFLEEFWRCLRDGADRAASRKD